MTATYHARRDDAGRRVLIRHPSTPTPPASWSDPAAVALFVPNGPAPAVLNGIAMTPWSPSEAAGAWEALGSAQPLDEPPFAVPAGLKPAAGVVLIEPDLRVFLAHPSNGFGGVAHVVPKGRIDPGGTSAATALREAWEELGLLAELTDQLVDVPRSVTYTRYYVGKRIDGSPSCMQWESQAVVLCPPARLPALLNGPHDGPLVAALLRYLGAGR
ncbi:MAG: NUDIX hydrolase [Comamonadaceae bacterium]|nr:MAG: NUDIX hydrolase [Comamonadaceae bacterium]